MTSLQPTSDRALLLDAGTIAVVSLLICGAADQLDWMTVLVPLVLVARTYAWTRLPRRERGSVRVELALLLTCTLLGAFNDWNSVVVHRVYDYTVPHYFPDLSTIPIWMLLFWGMILRSLITLFRWRRLGDPTPRDELWLGAHTGASGWGKIGVQLAFIAVTRQLLYRSFEDPILSWLPFAIALGMGLVLFRPRRRVLMLLGIFALVGPGIEILYIQVGGLHHYHHGILGGVPVWIALWWLLAVMIWDDFSGRWQLLLGRWLDPDNARFVARTIQPAVNADPTRSGISGACPPA